MNQVSSLVSTTILPEERNYVSDACKENDSESELDKSDNDDDGDDGSYNDIDSIQRELDQELDRQLDEMMEESRRQMDEELQRHIEEQLAFEYDKQMQEYYEQVETERQCQENEKRLTQWLKQSLHTTSPPLKNNVESRPVTVQDISQQIEQVIEQYHHHTLNQQDC